MLQRIQTIWLLLSATCGLLTFKYAFFSGNLIDEHQTKVFQELNSGSSILILLVSALVIIFSLIALLLYKNRKLQLRVNLVAIILSILNILLYYLQAKKFTEGNYNLTAILAIAIPVLLILAARGIYKDEKLVKSLDRLR
jgi:hypothetical protein